jgi:Putative transposase
MLAAGQRPAAARGGVELADIFRAYGESYRRHHPLPVSHRKVIEAVQHCRTAGLGATSSGVTPVALSAPPITPAVTAPPQADQSLAQARWLEKQKSELLPVGYFHLVFTLPHELNGLILTNKKILLSYLFKAVGETLVDFGHTRLGGQIGFLTVLHTWDQTLLDHFHLHCLVPAGALSFDQKHWTPARKNFLFPVKALSIVFRGKFLDLLKKTCDRKQAPLCRSNRTIPIDNHHCFTQRFSPTGFILNASDRNCSRSIASPRIQVKTYPFSSILNHERLSTTA